MQAVTEARIFYLDSSAGITDIPISMLKNGINPKNFNKIDHIQYVAPSFTYILSIHAWFSESRYNKRSDLLEEYDVIVSNQQLADNVGCHQNTADRVMQSLQAIFNLKFRRIHDRGGARIVTINERVIEFLKIYTYEEFQVFMSKYNLRGKGLDKALNALYRYRAWGVKPKYLEDHQAEARENYINKNKNFFHIVSTNHLSEQARIRKVDENKDKISDYNKSQLERIKEERKEGKLSHYWFHLLVKLYQKVKLALSREKAAKNQNDDTLNTQSQVANRNTEGNETTAHKAATRAAVKNPEDPEPELTMSYQEFMQFFMLWNSMADIEKMDQIKVITPDRIQSINKLVKSYGKANLFTALKRIRNLYHNADMYQYKMRFNRFIKDETFISVLESNSRDPRLESRDWEQGLANVMIDRETMMSVPEFENKSAALAWWNKQS